MMDELHVFDIGDDWVVARDLDDAWAVWLEFLGATAADDYSDQREELTQISDTRELTIWVGDSGKPDEPHGEGCTLATMLAAEWARQQGRGFLASSNY